MYFKTKSYNNHRHYISKVLFYFQPRSRSRYDLRNAVIVDEESDSEGSETALLSVQFKIRRNHI